MSKKEKRLSSRAMKLIDETRKRFSTRPKKAVEYLMSVDPNELNMFDKQKIGREILARYELIHPIGPNSPYFEDREGRFLRKIIKDYQVELKYPRKNVHRKKIPRFSQGYKQEKIEEYLLPSTNAGERLLSKDNGDREVEDAKKSEEEKDFITAIGKYISAGRSYEKAGAVSKSLDCYRKAQSYLEFNKEWYFESDLDRQRNRQTRYFSENQLGDIKRKIEDLERLRKSRLEMTTVLIIALIGIVGGLFFLSNNMTGNATGNSGTSNMLGIFLFLVGIIGIFFGLEKSNLV